MVETIDEELGVKVGTKEEAFWAQVRDVALKQIEELEKSLSVQRLLLTAVNDKLANESKTG